VENGRRTVIAHEPVLGGRFVTLDAARHSSRGAASEGYDRRIAAPVVLTRPDRTSQWTRPAGTAATDWGSEAAQLTPRSQQATAGGASSPAQPRFRGARIKMQ
jgi:hypothetical protein